MKERAALNQASFLREILRELELEFDPEKIQAIIDDYNKTLNSSHAFDFTDLVIKGHDLIQKVPWAQEIRGLNHVLVDELYVSTSNFTYKHSNSQRLLYDSQDTNTIQYSIIKHIVKPSRGSLSVVGDPDQSSKLCIRIYGCWIR
jgi:superfamily I DNA/RNA helicase